MKKLYIGTNTKMYKNIQQTKDFLATLGEKTADIDKDQCEIFVIPSYTALESAFPIARAHNIVLGAQNMAWEKEGPFTGEISPLMLKEVGVKIIEIGHSERRNIFGEDDYMENKKIHAALENGFSPLLCIGESQEAKKYKINTEVLRTQLKVGLFDISEEQALRVKIAYEPVWAIGEYGTPATKEYANEMHQIIKETLTELFGKTAAEKIPVIYGGSVNEKNASELIQMPYINGLFVGRSAWNAEHFAEMIHNVLNR